MSPFSPIAATASDATASGSSYLKLILCFFFLPNSCPFTKFRPNRTKNIEVKMMSYRSALVGWPGQSINSCIYFKLILFGFQPNISSQIRSNQNWKKNAEVEKIRHKSALVGQFGWSKNTCSHLKIILCCSLPNLIPHIKFHPNRIKKKLFGAYPLI